MKALVYPIFGFGEYDNTTADAGLKDLIEQLKVLNKHLEGKKFIVGESLTFADILVSHYVRAYLTFIIPEQQRKNMFTHITSWFTHVTSLPASIKAYGRTLLCKVPSKAAKVEHKQEEHHHHKKDEHKKDEHKKDEGKKEEHKKEGGDEEGDEEKPKKKQANPLDLLPPSTFVLDEFKKEFLNTTEKAAVLKEFWNKIDLNGYSFWYMQYQKLPSEGKILFKSNNSSSFFLQKLDPFRKYTFSCHGVYGVEGEYEIRGVWMWRGTDIPNEVKEHDNYEFMTIKKLDPTKEEDRNLISEYWLNISPGAVVDKMKVAEVVYFK